ncbi:MAG: acyl carrier protein, partial [Frankiaceae bacterium]|nr:acyl carrier protein [Frankiaceae bacterium]
SSFADLGADSLAGVSIADTVEAALPVTGFRIDDAVLGRMATLGDLVDHLREQLPSLAGVR